MRTRRTALITVHLAESFEKAVKHFEVSPPRMINLAKYDIFCIRRDNVLFGARRDYDDNGVFIKKLG